MLKRLMFGLIVGFYRAEPIDSELAPALGAVLRYVRNLICVVYALPVVDLGALSQDRSQPAKVCYAEQDVPHHCPTGGNK